MSARLNILTVGAILGICVFLMGMSGMGTFASQGGSASPFDAKITDTTKSEITISSVTIDGKTSFNAYMGKGKVQIPFENILRIDITEENACISLKDSDNMCNLRINGISRVYGKTPFGTYQIPLKDVVTIEFTKAR